jgi:elongation factor P
MIPVTSLRAGTTFAEEGELFEVLSYEHIKMGRGSANVKVKARNLRTGAIVEKSFISHAEVEEAEVTKKDLQFLYKDDKEAHFMDPETFEQFSLDVEKLAGIEFLKEGEMATFRFYKNEPIGLLLPPKVVLKVIEAAPGVAGDSKSNVYKDAILENGIKVRVPLFINVGDKIVVDTRDYSYTKRA